MGLTRKWKQKFIIGMLSLLCIMNVNLSSFIPLVYAAHTCASFYTHVSREKAEKNNLSFNFQNIDLRTLLQLIASNSGINFIISDNVKGNVTLRLKDVSWQQALAMLLKTHGLASRRIGNVIYISTIEQITNNETKQLQSEETIINLAPLRTKLVRLKYTNATDMATMLKGPQSNLLTSRGQVAVDVRSNSIILRDTARNLAEVIPEIRKLDIPAKQVLIEARIVNVNCIYEQEIGARFGLSKPQHLSGTFQGANSLAQGTEPAFVTNQAGTVDPTRRLNFNNPASVLFDGTNPGSIALAIARIGSSLLDLELSAIEGELHAKVVASPRVITSNQQKARIQTGEEIPYQEATSSGATSVVFKNAVLSLEITPQITPDNKIYLTLKATEDSRGQNINVGVPGSASTTIPAINTQEVSSNILLNNNETIVLGGVYKITQNHTIDRIPFFGSIPVFGYLFRHSNDHDEKDELLIFITPKIIENPTPFQGSTTETG